MVWRWNCFVGRLAALFFVVCGTFSSISVEAKEFGKKQITLGTKTLVVESAETPDQHQLGLMFRKELKKDQGMLFIFDNEETRFFWMKNTLIDLSIGYFDQKGILIDIQEMVSGKGVPDSALPSYPSAKPAMYALEMSKGWFTKNKIKLGTKLKVQ